jgi:hypothetical protein
MVNKEDTDNYLFKKSALDDFLKSKDSILIIAADPTKFIEPVEGHRSVFEEHEWLNIRKTMGKEAF